MKKFNMTLLTIILTHLLFIFTNQCSKSPTEPVPDDEAALVPWEKISGKIAYSRVDDSTGYLFIIDGTTKKVNLVKKSGEDHFDWLVWHPDGKRLVYVGFLKTSENAYHYQLYTINTDGSNRDIVYSVNAHNNFPACSSDGRIAYWYNGADHFSEIFIDNSPFFSEAKCNMTRPAWSPDGSVLVISMFDSTSQGSLYKVSLSDKSSSPILQGAGEQNQEIFADPIYSPDGSKIAYVRWGPAVSNDNSEIWIINADGTNPTRLTSGHQDNYPAWSPDGQSIMFSRGSAIHSRLFIMDSDGSDIVQVTKNKAHNPAWINCQAP